MIYETRIIIKENMNNNDIHKVLAEIKLTRNNNNNNNQIEEFDGHLIVDDIQSNRDILKRMLKILSIESETAENGIEALKKVKDKNYKLIWMDIKMPILNGIETSCYLRNNLNYLGKIYAVTAYSDNLIKNDCIDVGIDKIINKPISLKLLKDLSIQLESNKN